MPTALDLFAGAGGASLGLEAAGYDVIGVERDTHAAATQTTNGLVTMKCNVEDLNAADLPQWAFARPSPTVVGSFSPHVLAEPKWRSAGDGPRQNAPNSVTVTEAEAAMLQGFPDGYVFEGPKTARWLQIGNAAPPVLAQRLAEANAPTT